MAHRGDRRHRGPRAPALSTIIAEAERALEMGERKQRARELQKAAALFDASRTQLLTTGLCTDRAGCLIFAAASTALLDVEQDTARIAAFSCKPDRTARAAALGRRRAVLTEVSQALAVGASAAATAGASTDERSHLAETAGTVQQLLSEVYEEQLDGPSALACAARAVEYLDEALQLHLRAAEAAAAEMREPAAAEPSIELLRTLAPALMAFGKLALQAADAAPDSGAGAPPAGQLLPWAEVAAGASGPGLRAQGERAVERSLSLLEEACGLCDSERGDDLPQAVEEWARLLWEASALSPPGSRAGMLERAVAKCQEALGLVRVSLASTSVLLGDILRAAAEEAASPLAGAADVPGATEHWPAAVTAVRLYGRAIADGYNRALTVSRTDIAAQLGAADARLECARLVRKLAAVPGAPAVVRGGADEYSALVGDPSACLGAALQGYASLGARPLSDWTAAGLSAEEHSDFRFNWACAAALRGAEDTARQLLTALVKEGRVVGKTELSADEDLQVYSRAGWMHELLLQLQ